MRRILIADDSPAVRKSLARLLQRAYAVSEVEDGQAALACALELRPDLIILDLAMPVMDGLTAAREISSVLPEIPILLYTMHSVSSLELAAQTSGIRKVVLKGRSQELLAAVEELLQVRPSAPNAVGSVPEQLNPSTAPSEPAIIAAAEQPDGQTATEMKRKKLAS